MTVAPASKATPRPRDAQATRETILRTAQRLFADKGYATTGVREIAAEAGINSSLVRRYFGSKEGLFRAAIEEVLLVEPFISGPREDFGRRAVEILLAGDDLPSPMAIMLLASADPSARRLCQDLLKTRIFDPLAAWLDCPDGQARAERLNILWVGFMTVRQVFLPEAARDRQLGATREWLIRQTQAAADGT